MPVVPHQMSINKMIRNKKNENGSNFSETVHRHNHPESIMIINKSIIYDNMQLAVKTQQVEHFKHPKKPRHFFCRL